MKHATSVPKNIRIIDREGFLSSVETRGNLLLRARTENPGNYLLVLFCDPAERYVILGEIGPEAQFADIREAVRRAPAGFSVHYIVPCTHCPPFIIPRGHDIVPLPQSICTLTPPPADFQPEVVDADPEAVAADDASTPSFKMIGAIATGVSGISFTKKAKSPPPGGSRATTAPFASVANPDQAAPVHAESAGAPSVVVPTAVPLMSQTILDAQRALAERETDLRRRETELAVKTTSLSKERRLLEDDSQRINAEIENRESELFRREAELQSRADALLRAIRELDDVRRKIESLCGRNPVGR